MSSTDSETKSDTEVGTNERKTRDRVSPSKFTGIVSRGFRNSRLMDDAREYGGDVSDGMVAISQDLDSGAMDVREAQSHMNGFGKLITIAKMQQAADLRANRLKFSKSKRKVATQKRVVRKRRRRVA